MTRFSLLFAAVLFASPVIGGEHRDPSGFIINYPPGWFALTKEVMAKGYDAIPAELREMLKKSNFDHDKMSISIIREGKEEVLENLNVVVLPQQMPIDEMAVRNFTAGLPQYYQSVGAKVDSLVGRVQQYGDRETITLDYEVQLPGVPHQLRQRQVFFAGDGKTFIVTCSAKKDTFDLYATVFDSMLSGFKTPEPTKVGFDWNQILIAGVVGAVVSLLITVVIKFIGSKKAAA